MIKFCVILHNFWILENCLLVVARNSAKQNDEAISEIAALLSVARNDKKVFVQEINKTIAATGIPTNPTTINVSIAIKKIRIKRSAKIIKVLINIPIPIEKPTNPFLYSFLKGIKKVFTKRGNENISKKALFKELKNANKPTGASKNQNRRKIKGRFK